MARGFGYLFGCSLLLGAACAEPPVALSPQARAVQVGSTDPPAGAENLGPIEAKDGEDCDIVSEKGTRERATATLKEAAARRGIDFVKLTTVREPFSDHECYHKAYVLKGIGFRVKRAPVSPPAAAVAAAAAAPVAASGAPPIGPSAPSGCEPPCAPGFVCQAGVCAAACEPACVLPQICRADRVCVTPAQ